MYYITNRNGWVIAADEAMLRYTGAATIEELQAGILAQNVRLPEDEITLDDTTYRAESHTLHTLLGEWRLTAYVPIVREETSDATDAGVALSAAAAAVALGEEALSHETPVLESADTSGVDASDATEVTKEESGEEEFIEELELLDAGGTSSSGFTIEDAVDIESLLDEETQEDSAQEEKQTKEDISQENAEADTLEPIAQIADVGDNDTNETPKEESAEASASKESDDTVEILDDLILPSEASPKEAEAEETALPQENEEAPLTLEEPTSDQEAPAPEEEEEHTPVFARVFDDHAQEDRQEDQGDRSETTQDDALDDEVMALLQEAQAREEALDTPKEAADASDQEAAIDLLETTTQNETLSQAETTQPETQEQEDDIDEEIAKLFETAQAQEEAIVTPEKEPSAQEAKESSAEASDEALAIAAAVGGVAATATAKQEISEASQETPPAPSVEDQTPRVAFDAQRNADEIGVSVNDYMQFVAEFAQTLQTDLHAADGSSPQQIEQLRHLALVLRLYDAADMLEALKNDSSQTAKDAVIRTVASYVGEMPEPSTQAQTQEPVAAQEPEIGLKPTEEEEEGYIYDTIDLSDVEPIHFDFTIEEAAQDLSLPTELIEEFIQDFIKQAHEETERMIKAYRKGDLETVQKIGHLLKGTSSNLRIAPLADTLYEIQFNDDITKVPELVRNYWGHFLSLENQMRLLMQ